MPAKSYSLYEDPITKKTFWLPQLFPHSASTGGMTREELEGWVKAGVIPKEVYEKKMLHIERLHDLSQKIKNGYPIPQEISSRDFILEQQNFTQFLLKNKSQIYGENVLKKIYSQLIDEDPDIVWLSFIKEAITCLATTDPQAIHQFTARKYLKEKRSIEDSLAVDKLARALVEHCGRLLKLKTLSHPVFEKIIPDPQDLDEHFESGNGLLQLDEDFINYIKQIGKTGKEIANQVREDSKNIYSNYKESNYSTGSRRDIWSLWVPLKENLTSLFLSVLAKVLWEDCCSKEWNSLQKLKSYGHASISKPSSSIMIDILSPKKSKKIIEKENEIIMCDNKGSPIFHCPAIDESIVSVFRSGVDHLSTLTAHKVLRGLVREGFNNLKNGKDDFRVIRIEGGFTYLTELFNCDPTNEIFKVKAILNFLAYGCHKYPDGSYGNAIILNILDRHKNNEPSRIEITLGPMLTGTDIYSLKGSDRRLIPVIELPPLQGARNTHAAQAQLQLHVVSEMSEQSTRIVERGSVLIPKQRWQEMASLSGLNPKKIDLVVDHWCQPDLLRNFLIRDGDEYQLASYFNDATKFLEDQGLRRITNSKRGKKSIELKRGKSKK